MAYTPKLEDIQDLHKEDEKYQPSLADIVQEPVRRGLFDPVAPTELQPEVSELGKAIVSGAAEPGRGLANLLRQLPGLAQVSRPLTEEDIQLLSPEERQTGAARLGRFVGETAPMLATGGVTGLLEAAGLQAPLAAAGGLGAVGAATTPGTAAERLQAGLIGGGLGGAGEIATSALARTPGLLSRIIGGNVSPEEFKAAREAIPEGIKMPIGDLADSARAQQLYGSISSLAGSGAQRPYQKLNEFLKNKQSEIIGKPTIDPQDINQSLYDHVYHKYSAAKENTHDAYDALAASADAVNTPFDKKELDEALKDRIGDLKSKMTTKAAKNLYKPHVDAMEDFANADFDNFKAATDQIPVVNDLLSDARGKNDRLLTRTYTGIKNGLENAIKDSSKQNPELFNLYKDAKAARVHQGTFENLNKKEFTPFYKTYIKDGDPANFVNQYVKPSKGTVDQSGILESLTSKLDDDAKDALASAYLKSDTFSQFSKKLGNLNEKQRSLLLGENAPDAEHLLRLSKAIPEAKIAGFVPKTGLTGAKGLQAGASGIGALQALLAGHPASAAMYAGAIPALGQVSQRLLRSEALKDAFAKSLQRGLQAQDAPTSEILRNLSRALALQGAQTAGGQ